jgi:hypothetical protein
MTWLWIALGAAGFLYSLHRLASFAEARGWIFYRTRPPRVRMLGFLEEIVQPSVEHLIEERASEEIRADRGESGQGHGRRGDPVRLLSTGGLGE